AVTLFHVEVGDFAERVGSDIDVDLRLDFSRCSYHRGKVFTDHFARLNRYQTLPALLNREAHNPYQKNDGANNECNLLPIFHQSSVTRPALIHTRIFNLVRSKTAESSSEQSFEACIVTQGESRIM